MSTEQFANSAATTINQVGGINSSTTSMPVASATGFPGTGNFRILVDSEIMLVTGVSGTTFTVVRAYEGPGVATPHANGAAVTEVLTAGVMTNLTGLTQPLSQAPATSVIANPTNAAANVTSLQATANGQVMVRRSGLLTFGTLVTTDLPITGPTDGGVVVYDGATAAFRADSGADKATLDCASTGVVTVGGTGKYVAVNSPLVPYQPLTGNPVINGCMDHWQRGTSFSDPGTGTGGGYTADRWKYLYSINSGGAVTVSQQPDAPAVSYAAGSPTACLTKYCLEVKNTSTVSLNAADSAELVQYVEYPYRSQWLSGRPFQLVFWFKSNYSAANIPVLLYDGTNYYKTTFTPTGGGTWQKVVIPVPAQTFAAGASYLAVVFYFVVGSSNTGGSNNAWTTSTYAAAASINAFNAANNYFRFTQVEIQPCYSSSGSNLICYPYPYRGLDEELLLCQRYLHVMGGYTAQYAGTGLALSSTTGVLVVPHPVSLRAAPILTYSALADWTVYNGVFTPTAIGYNSFGPTQSSISFTVASGMTAGNAVIMLAASTSSRIYFNADF